MVNNKEEPEMDYTLTAIGGLLSVIIIIMGFDFICSTYKKDIINEKFKIEQQYKELGLTSCQEGVK